METVLKAIADWIKGILTAGIMSNLSGLFDDVNAQVGNIAQQVGTKPSSFEPRVFAMIEAHSRNVVLPIAGIILTFIACYELIEMITQHNNMAQFEPALIMRWIFKTAVSVWLISNTFDIVMAVFDITQKVVSDSSGIIAGNTRLTKRQLLCFGTAALIGVPLFFVLRDSGGNTAATLGMMAVMLPAFFLGMYEKNGQPMEKLLSYYVQSRFLRPKIRPYKTNNYYAILMKGGVTHDPVLEKDR